MQSEQQAAVLLVLDGWGLSEDVEHNAIAAAKTPCWDQLLADHPHAALEAHGPKLGLPEGQMGNSEVGHMHIGGGRTVLQDLVRINNCIEKNELGLVARLKDQFEFAAKAESAVHLFGLLSDGGVHSHSAHFKALAQLAVDCGVQYCYIHAFLDGRDTSPKSALPYLTEIDNFGRLLDADCRVVSVIGRFYAMDRDNRWERTRDAYRLLVEGEAHFEERNVEAAVMAAYERGEKDEFVSATRIEPNDTVPVQVRPNDVLVSVNFRADRARQLCQMLTNQAPSEATLEKPIQNRLLVMTDYPGLHVDTVIFPKQPLDNTLGSVVADQKLKQLRIAETEKYAHVTFFLNGGTEKPFSGEARVMIPSPKVKTYDLKPEMSLPELTRALVEAIESKRYHLIVCNIANADMVGHTGNFEAAVQAVESIDFALSQIVEAAAAANMDLFMTADHGNIEKMYQADTAEIHTAHTCHPVPFLYLGDRKAKLDKEGSLVDVAPTVLAAMGLDIPDEMEGQSLIEF